MKNGIVLFRERMGLNQADLSRRTGIGRQQLGRLENGKRKLTREWAEKIVAALPGVSVQELMFPEMARIDTKRFSNVFEIVENSAADEEVPRVAIDAGFLSRLLPGVEKHRLRLMMVDTEVPGAPVSKGDAVIIDADDVRPSRPGLYALNIADVIQWRYLTPTTGGLIHVHGEVGGTTAETVKPDDLTVVGRARLRISTL